MTSQSGFDEILTTHRKVRSLERRLQDSDDEDVILEILSALPEMLGAHFAYEERPGSFFDRIAKHHQGSKVAQVLRQEHKEILTLLEQILEQPPPRKEAALQLARLLHRHEQKESNLAASFVAQPFP